MQINDQLINQIVDTVVQRLSESEVRDHPPAGPPSTQNTGASGVFQSMDDCIPAAVAAQKNLLNLPLDTRRLVIQAIRDATVEAGVRRVRC